MRRAIQGLHSENNIRPRSKFYVACQSRFAWWKKLSILPKKYNAVPSTMYQVKTISWTVKNVWGMLLRAFLLQKIIGPQQKFMRRAIQGLHSENNIRPRSKFYVACQSRFAWWKKLLGPCKNFMWHAILGLLIKKIIGPGSTIHVACHSGLAYKKMIGPEFKI